MNSIKKQLLVLVLIIFFPLNSTSQGLLFHGGRETQLQDRSSYSVFNEKNYTFENCLDINFKFFLHDRSGFGCIFLLENVKTKTEYNLMYIHGGGDYYVFKLNIGGKDNILTMKLNSKEIEHSKWIDFSFHFDLDADSVSITIGNQTFSKRNLNLSKVFESKLTFGFSERYVEVPHFGLCDLQVGNAKTHYSFPLNESGGSQVHDNKGHIIGTVSNPIWLINSAYHWKKHLELTSTSPNAINYKESTQDMLFAYRDSIDIYNMQTCNLSSHKYTNPPAVTMWLSASFMDNINNKLYVYEAHDCKNCEGTIAYIDLDSYEWRATSDYLFNMQLHHHSGYLDTKQNKYFIFGGFGNLLYNQNFYAYSLSTQEWSKMDYTGDKIAPRYFQGMGASNDNLYIFGGMGNDSGDQTIGRRNYYDLHKLNLKTKECTKLWEIDWNKKDIVVARNIVVFGDSILYALCYPEYESNTYAQLYKFSTKDGSYEVLGDSIPFISNEILTNINLYYNDFLQEFYCVVQEVNKDESTRNTVYSLAYPGVSKESLIMYQQSESIFVHWNLIIASICLIIIFILLFILYQKRTNKTKEKNTNFFIRKRIGTENRFEKKENGIYLFGDFTLYDKNGKDITYMLSTRLRNTFILVLEYSLREGGITSQQLSNILWSDKDEYSAKNLRGVTINQLRKILTEQNGIKLIFDKGLYTLIIKDECFCDCKYILELMNSNIERTSKSNEINDILSRGIFLKSVDEPTFESFRLLVKDNLTINLPIYIEEAFHSGNDLLVIQLSDHLLQIDSLDETILAFQLRSLYNLKQESEAKKRYTSFYRNYNKLTNKFPKDLADLLDSIK